MALDETGLLVKLEADNNRWRRSLERVIAQQQKSNKRMEQIARQNANKPAFPKWRVV